MPSALALALLLVAAPAKPAGNLTGRVILEGPAPKEKLITIGVDPKICGASQPAGTLLVGKGGALANAVVTLDEPPAAGKAALPAVVTMDQRGCAFAPHILLLPKGGTVKFLNSDPVLHNTRVNSAAEAMNRVQAKGVTVEKKFESGGIHPVKCDFHHWMNGYVVVAEHAYYAVTDGEGRFSFDVPEGKYDLHVWHETLGVAEGSLSTGKAGELKYPAAK